MKTTKFISACLATVISCGLVSCTQRSTSTSHSPHGDTTSVSPHNLHGVWHIRAYNDLRKSSSNLIKVVNKPYKIELLPDSTFFCVTDCNSLSGKYAAKGDSLTFAGMAYTEMACDDMVIENNLKSILPQIRAYHLSNDTLLSLKNDSDHLLLLLCRIPRSK